MPDAQPFATALQHPQATSSWILVGPSGSGRRAFLEQICDAAGVEPGQRTYLIPEPGKTIPIDALRAATQRLRLTSPGLRVLIIPDVDVSLTEVAVQALLKTAEDAPRNARILMTASQPGRLPPTLLSRTTRITMPLPSLAEATAVLTQEGVPAEHVPALFRLAHQSLGQARVYAAQGVIEAQARLLAIMQRPAPWPRGEIQKIAQSVKDPQLLGQIALDLLRQAMRACVHEDPALAAYVRHAQMPKRIAQGERVLRDVLGQTRALTLEPRQACVRVLLCLEWPIQ